MEKLVHFYKQVLDFAGMSVDENGFVHSFGVDRPVVTVEDKVMVIPTRTQLASLSDDKEVFHPLTEDVFLAMPKYLRTYLYRLNGVLNVRFAELLVELYNFVNSSAKDSALSENPARLQILRNVQGTEASEKKTEEFVMFVAKQLSENPSGCFLEISAARGALYKGKKQARVGFTAFKLYHELKEDLTKLRKDAKFKNLCKENNQILVQLYEAIFPGLDQPEEYNWPYETGPYPFFTTILNTALRLAIELNRVTDAFEGVSDTDLTPLPLDWVSTFEDKTELAKIGRMVGRLDNDVALVPAKEANTAGADERAQPLTRQTAALPVNVAETKVSGPKPTKVEDNRPSMEEWLSTRGQYSAMGAAGARMEAVNRHNRGYAAFIADFMQKNNNMMPAGFPPPSTIPNGAVAPMYPGADPAILMVLQPPAVQQPQMVQQPVLNQYGQVVGMQQVPVMPQGYGGQMPMVQGGYGYQQPMVQGGYGYQQPVAQGGFQINRGGTVQQGYQAPYGMATPSTHSGQIMPGTV